MSSTCLSTSLHLRGFPEFTFAEGATDFVVQSQTLVVPGSPKHTAFLDESCGIKNNVIACTGKIGLDGTTTTAKGTTTGTSVVFKAIGNTDIVGSPAPSPTGAAMTACSFTLMTTLFSLGAIALTLL